MNKNHQRWTSKSLRVKRGEKLSDAAIRRPEFTNLTGSCLSFFRHQELFSTGSGKQGTTISNLVPENFVQVKYCWWLKSCGFLLFAISFAITPCFCFGSQVKTPDLLIGWVGHSLQVAEDGSQVTNSIRRKGGNNDFSKFAKKIPGWEFYPFMW